jgi:hypothetical protein
MALGVAFADVIRHIVIAVIAHTTEAKPVYPASQKIGTPRDYSNHGGAPVGPKS